MIKEYFTDGLIGLAILLSLFRTDLVGINNLINYPEVQDIILGQTAAYLPTNFHHIQNAPQAFGNPKYLDYDNDAFTAWYQNVDNFPIFQQPREYQIQAFLVNSPSPHIGEQLQSDRTITTVSGSNNVLEPTSSTLAEESDSTFAEIFNSVVSLEEDHNATVEASASTDLTSNVNVSLFFNSTFPGCNLTLEDLNLIDILYQQDVDLGIGKEVFDPSMREVLDRERELELAKQQERQKTQLLAIEKKEREKQELKDRWLKTNFRRDGETGEWVHVRSGTTESYGTLPVYPSNEEETFSLEDALDFLGNLQRDQEEISADSYHNNQFEPILDLPVQQFDTRPEQQQPEQEPQKHPALEHQDSFDENWSVFVDYLNMTANNSGEVDNDNITLPPLTGDNDNSLRHLTGDHDDSLRHLASDHDDSLRHLTGDNDTSLLQITGDINTNLDLIPSDFSLEQNQDLQKNFLIENATLPSPITYDAYPDLSVMVPIEELDTSVPLQSSNNSMIDFDFNDLSFLGNTLQNETTGGFDFDEVSDLLGNIQETNDEALVEKTLNLADNMDPVQMLQDSYDTPSSFNGSASPFYDFGEPFDALEGATGGSDYNTSYGHDHFSKVSRLSESSNDSGYVNQGAFSSSPSSTPSYAGSPAGSQNGITNSTSSNDTEHDPHGTHTVEKHHVAHNHTYNTAPGQIPREVKKYAHKEPSRKGPHSRDQRRAEELKIPFTIDDIIESPVETFNELLTKHKLSEAQLSLVRDIRRRGKNKVAAQNCRKRKVGVIFNLTDEMVDLQKMRDRLVAERAAMDREQRKMKEKVGHLYTHIFQSLRDERGELYDPRLYSLQQSSDGSVFLVPRNQTVTKSSQSSSSSSNDSTGSKKRKSFDS